MPLTLLVGGARSGKSSLAVTLARSHTGPVTFIATAEAGDDEMRDRIALHRKERPQGWRTLEEPVELVDAITSVDPADCLLIDCLTLWVANLLERESETVVTRVADAAAAASGRPGRTIAVSNEVGMGIVPASPFARRYRDLLGQANAVWAAAAEDAWLVVAGRALPLLPLPFDHIPPREDSHG
jgi:adenosyl cobinamide kinase/adenosyl cobinamide phosphate guanylyltransferase